MENSDPEDKQTIDVEVDPHRTTLADLLAMAEEHNAGTITVKGEMDDGTVQWGIVVTCGDNASRLMADMQITVDKLIAKLVSAKMN